MIFHHAQRTVCQSMKGKNVSALAFAFLVLVSQSGFCNSFLYSTFPSVEDAYVKPGFSSKKNFGGENILEVQSGRGGSSEAFIKFNLTGVDANLKEARLRVFAGAEKADSTTILVGSTGTGDWSEGTLTWKEKPEQFKSVGRLQTIGTAGAWYEMDMTDFVKAEVAAHNRIISLVFLMGENSNNKISIYSRESGANAPQIVVGRGLFAAKIVFQPKEKTPPVGYVADSGTPFGPHEKTGMTYGWSSDISAFVKDRGNPGKDDPKPAKGPDVRYMGVASMDDANMKAQATWEMAVPNGKYKVHLVAGDASYDDSIYAVNVEGVTVAEGVPDATKRWVEGAQIVTVNDGRLTVSNHPKGVNNKLCFLEVAEVAGQ